MAMEIRRAAATDSDKIYSLHTELKTGDFDKNKFDDLLKRELQNPNIHHLVAMDGREFIGHLGGKIEERLTHDRKVATIEGMIVASKYRGQGVGKKLFSTFETIVKKNNCAKVEVCSKLERENAHRFYIEKAGMKKTHLRLSKHYS